MPEYTHLKSMYDFSQSSLLDQIEKNLIEFFNWGLVEAGAFTDVLVENPGTSDPYNQDSLYPIHKDGILDGRIWQSVHPNWCYQTGLDRADSPTIASGVYVNGVYYPTISTTGPFAHSLDFRHGRVTFNSPITQSSIVQVPYSYHRVSFYDQNVPWFRPIIFDAFLVEQSSPNGVVALLDDYRVSTPLVVVEGVLRRKLTGLMLGSGAHRVEQDVLFHIVADSKEERDQVADVLLSQQNKSFYLFDVNSRKDADAFLFDWKGQLRSDAMQYPDLVSLPPDGFRWKLAYVLRTQGQEVDLKLPLFRGIVRMTIELAV